MDNNTSENTSENTGNLFTNIEENIQEVISNSIRNYFSTMPPFNRNNRTRNPVNNSSDIVNIIRESMHISNDIMRSYNNNINEFNTNMRDLIRILQNINNNNNNIRRQQMRTTEPFVSIPRNPIQQTNLPRNTIPRMNSRDYLQNRRSNVLGNPPFNIFENIMPFFPYTFQDVVIRPTDTEIENACELFEYMSSIELINSRCPITLSEFQQGDQVRRIRHCGHTFIADAIISWFQNNVICPVCRYDIRNYNEENTENTENTESTENENNEESTENENNEESTENENNEESTENDVSLNAFTTIYNPEHYTTSMTISQPIDVSSLHSHNDSFNNISSPIVSPSESINSSLENILRAALSLDASNNNNLNNLLNTDTSNRQQPIFRLEVPFEYEEYYDASNNFLGNNTNHFS